LTLEEVERLSVQKKQTIWNDFIFASPENDNEDQTNQSFDY